MIPLMSARSDRGFTGRWRSASMAVFVTRGSTTISVLLAIGFETLPENRMVVGDVRADQQDDVGAFEILVRARRAVAAERSLVAGHGGRHAQRRVAVVIPRAEAELRQLAERIELLGDELAGADDADGVVAVTPLHVTKARRHRRGARRPSRRDGTSTSATARYSGCARARRAHESSRAPTGPSGRARRC